MSKTLDPDAGAADLSRRSLLSHTLAAGTAVLVPLASSSCATSATGTAATPASVFASAERATLAAVVDRLVPADDLSPAASACGVLDYFDRCLGEWNQHDVPLLRQALATLNAQARTEQGADFAALAAPTQDSLLLRMEAGQLPEASAQAGFSRLLRLTLEGMFSDPYYGGNRNYAGWDLIGYPGAVLGSTRDMQAMGARSPLLHTSAYGVEHDGH